MAEWLEQASQWHEMCCHDLEVMSSNPGQVELGVVSTEVTDSRAFRAGISVTWNVLSWFKGHEFEPQSGRTCGA